MPSSLTGRRIGLLTSMVSRLSGGVGSAVIAHAAMIRDLGGEAVIFGLADQHSDEDRHRYEPSVLHDCPVVGPGAIGYAPKLLPQLMAADLDCLHLHGIWMYPSRAGAVWARRTGRPYFISPHGMLDPWITARGRWKKAAARLVYERDNWRRATALHGLTRREAGDIRAESGRDDTIVIANAGPPPVAVPTALRPAHVVFISRIHPKKNLLPLVEGWREANLPEDSRLTIAGWGEPAHVAEVKVAVAGAGESVSFIGPIFGEGKQALLESARFVILPSLSEGLPITVLEAWAAAAPTIMTGECNLPEGFDTGAAIECGYDAPAIARALEAALDKGEGEWLGMARAALGLAGGRFSAQGVAAQWAQTYTGAIAATPKARGRGLATAR